MRDGEDQRRWDARRAPLPDRTRDSREAAMADLADDDGTRMPTVAELDRSDRVRSRIEAALDAMPQRSEVEQ